MVPIVPLDLANNMQAQSQAIQTVLGSYSAQSQAIQTVLRSESFHPRHYNDFIARHAKQKLEEDRKKDKDERGREDFGMRNCAHELAWPGGDGVPSADEVAVKQREFANEDAEKAKEEKSKGKVDEEEEEN